MMTTAKKEFQINIFEVKSGEIVSIPVIKAFGNFAVHRCISWHLSKSWAFGSLGPIPLDISPSKHNKMAQDILETQLNCINSEFAAKIKKIYGSGISKSELKKAQDYNKNIYVQRSLRLDEIKETFAVTEIYYSVSLFPDSSSSPILGLALGWRSLHTLYTKTDAESFARNLNFMVPSDMALKLLRFNSDGGFKNDSKVKICCQQITKSLRKGSLFDISFLVQLRDDLKKALEDEGY